VYSHNVYLHICVLLHVYTFMFVYIYPCVCVYVWYLWTSFRSEVFYMHVFDMLLPLGISKALSLCLDEALLLPAWLVLFWSCWSQAPRVNLITGDTGDAGDAGRCQTTSNDTPCLACA
jgi:hypothetical protein